MDFSQTKEEFNAVNVLRSRAGLLLQGLGLSRRERREWFAAHEHIPPASLVETIRLEFRSAKHNGGPEKVV